MILTREFGILFAMLATTCAANPECINADSTNGHYGIRSYIFNQEYLLPNKKFEYPMSFNCDGKYNISIGFVPREDIQVGLVHDREKRYFEEIQISGEETIKKHLDDHVIAYQIRVVSISDPSKSVEESNSLVVPAYEFSFSPMQIDITSDFGRNEKLLVTLSIQANDSFYEYYPKMANSIRVSYH